MTCADGVENLEPRVSVDGSNIRLRCLGCGRLNIGSYLRRGCKYLSADGAKLQHLMVPAESWSQVVIGKVG